MILHSEFGWIWTTPWPDQKELFLKFVIREIRKFRYEKLTFFLNKLYQNLFFFYTLPTQGILHYEFGSIWTTFWPNEKELFLKFLILEIQKFPYETVWISNYFTRQAIAKIHLILQSTYTGDTPFQVWFNLNNIVTQ